LFKAKSKKEKEIRRSSFQAWSLLLSWRWAEARRDGVYNIYGESKLCIDDQE
jgi:hypothetical protein